jgi:GNAT superfamily N-acetyltransferase
MRSGSASVIAMEVCIRPARESDADDIARLTAQLGYDVATSALRPRLQRMLARPEQQLFVAEVEGRAAGWLHAAVFEDIEAEPFVVIGGLVVDRSCRRKGIGRMLMAQAEDWARQQGCSMVRLWSSATRTASHRFYEQMGYTNIKTQYSFAKSLQPAGHDELNRLVPRVEG